MKNLILIASILLFQFTNAQLDPNGVLILNSGTTAEINAISPDAGALVYNTDTKKTYVYDGTNWVLASGGPNLVKRTTTIMTKWSGKGSTGTSEGTYSDRKNSWLGYNSGNANTTGYNNVSNGHLSLYNNTVGYNNLANGFRALNSNINGSNNIANGSLSLHNNTTGNNNTANGSSSLTMNTTGIRNVANGTSSLHYNKEGSRNVANGFNAMYSNTTGNYNTANGYQSLKGNKTGLYNVATGANAGSGTATGNVNTGGSYNIFLGANTKPNTNNTQNEIVIGANAIGNGSNSITLGHTNITKTLLRGNVGVGTTNPTTKLEVAGQIKMTGGNPGAGKILTSDANGLATWQNPSNTVEGILTEGDTQTMFGSAPGSSIGNCVVSHGIATFFTSTSDNNYMHIKLPYRIDTHNNMYHIKATGYRYGAAKTIDITWTGYCYKDGSNLLSTNHINNGSPEFEITQYIGSDNHIYLRFKGTTGSNYYQSFRIDSMKVGNGSVLAEGDIQIISSASANL